MKKKITDRLNLTKINYIILSIAIIVIITGYIVMKYVGDDLGDKTISPILLTIGYVVLIPLALFYKTKRVDE
ncbi:hypothetical protein JEZ13_09865 [bacterium]|nr:hypothetical protein [bacterium]